MARKYHHQQPACAVTAPAAMNVLLAGDFARWQEPAIPLQMQSNEVWKAAAKLAPDTCHNRFSVGGQWRDDPDCALRVANPYGGADAMRQTVLPCRISIYEKGEKIVLATLKPTTLRVLFNPPPLKTVAQEVEDTIVKIIKEAAAV